MNFTESHFTLNIFRFAEFTEQIEIDSAISSDGFVYDPPTPDYVKCKFQITLAFQY